MTLTDKPTAVAPLESGRGAGRLGSKTEAPKHLDVEVEPRASGIAEDGASLCFGCRQTVVPVRHPLPAVTEGHDNPIRKVRWN